ncbi:Increased DNA methylation 1 isoform A [Senna tora]|uniref:Increased DNA methylation 1 isoform A n=1 Tax=Senna tora TaxID=362788 RepID=A0A834X426_9FABA|nr:Increased DNA methylation 1 isoform A [Senna tora]
MEPGMRSAGPSGVVVKNRNSSGCLIVKKKADALPGGVGSSSSRKLYDTKKVRKRHSMALSDSGSSDELLLPPSRRVGPETLRVCNALTGFERGIVEGSEFGRKRDRMAQLRRSEDGLIDKNGFEERETKRNRLDVYDFDEYDGIHVENMRRRHFDDNGGGFGGGRYMGSMHAARSGIEREFDTGSSRPILEKRKNSYYDRASGMYTGNNLDHSRFKMDRDGAQLPLPLLREKFVGNADESIRVQGKNGVLKVMVNKKKVGGTLKHYDHHKPVESQQNLRSEGSAKRNVLIHPSSYSETTLVEKSGLVVRPDKKKIISRKSLSSKESKGDEWDSENSDTSLNPVHKNTEARKSVKRASSEDEQTPLHEKLPTTKVKEGKVRRGSGTEKQKLREKIREMLLGAGWTIDYRPRRNRDYLDAVYINPGGTAYWSIIKAYDALQKQLIEDDKEVKPRGDGSSFALISDEVLSQLTRKTRKKMEKELKEKQKDCSESDSEKEPQVKRSAGNKRTINSFDSDSNEEKLSSFIKQGNKSMKNKITENAISGASSKSHDPTHHSNEGSEKLVSGGDPHLLHGRRTRKHGRCTLLVRSSNKGSNSESDGFVPYTGKRTVLSWLIDSGTVQLSQKVQYRKRKRVMLEGWITRDGIHCGCCSKILTVSKFEIHAGSKLRQPFQNIYLDSGVSLLQCQIDAWNRQENSEKITFHSVDIDGDDPNDDTCGICGDGGDLICCDGCPSTFHQNCLDIQMLPPGEWHCPNCTCKFCGIASGTFKKGDDVTVYDLQTCKLCEKKYHESCVKEMDALPDNANVSGPLFCGEECKELFEHLKKYLGAKHELEAGFSWSLIHRTDEEYEAATRGISQRVECNSKLAVALTVMDECFLPVVDRRSGISLIHNVLYNSGSNFNRLNYSGFYTAVLERGDDIISAASIRFHGTKLAEMPFIGTRHIYRRQGMCRRLFSAIESALCSLKVEKLVIPAISELVHTWTTVFGFKPLQESLRQDMRSLNMMVFPGIDMLQKVLVKQDKLEGKTTTTGAQQMEKQEKVSIKPNMSDRLDMDSSAQNDPRGSDDTGSNPANETTDECSDVELNNQALVDGTVCSKSHSGNRLTESASGKCVSPSSTTSHGDVEIENKLVLATPVKEKFHPSPKCEVISPNDAPDSHENPTLVRGTACSNSDSAENLVEPVSNWKCHSPTMNCDSSDLEKVQVVHNAIMSSKDVDMTDAREVDEAVPSEDLSEENVTKGINENIDVSGSTRHRADASFLLATSSLNGETAYKGETNLYVGTEVASNVMHSDSDESSLNVSTDSSETDSE